MDFTGGAAETSMMLHLRPDLVRADRLGESRSLGQDLEADLSRARPRVRGRIFLGLLKT